MTRESEVDVGMRVVDPAAIGNPSLLFKAMNPLSRPYFLLDSAPEAGAFHGLPFRRPVPDPIIQEPADPRDRRGTSPSSIVLAGSASPLRNGVADSPSATGSHVCFGTVRVDNWHEGDHLARAAERAGLDLAELDRAITVEPERHEAVLAANDTALRATGHWGVPTACLPGRAILRPGPLWGRSIWRLPARRARATWLDAESPS